jgi:hypothetical protein
MLADFSGEILPLRCASSGDESVKRVIYRETLFWHILVDHKSPLPLELALESSILLCNCPFSLSTRSLLRATIAPLASSSPIPCLMCKPPSQRTHPHTTLWTNPLHFPKPTPQNRKQPAPLISDASHERHDKSSRNVMYLFRE